LKIEITYSTTPKHATTLHLGLLLIFGSDYAIVLLLQYLFQIGRWLLMLLTLVIAGLGQHVVTVLVAAMDEQALDVVIANPTILQQVVDFTIVITGASNICIYI
jgi:hypothetical protein